MYVQCQSLGLAKALTALLSETVLSWKGTDVLLNWEYRFRTETSKYIYNSQQFNISCYKVYLPFFV